MNRLLLQKDKTYQTFERFGVSGAWWAQVVGGWTQTDEKSGLPTRERMAELLFDREKGIGVRCYRYNLGAGSAQSGKGNFSLDCRRAESFDTEDDSYDWNRDARRQGLSEYFVGDKALVKVKSRESAWQFIKNLNK